MSEPVAAGRCVSAAGRRVSAAEPAAFAVVVVVPAPVVGSSAVVDVVVVVVAGHSKACRREPEHERKRMHRCNQSKQLPRQPVERPWPETAEECAEQQ